LFLHLFFPVCLIVVGHASVSVGAVFNGVVEASS